jgi:hypothetical protein
MVEVNVRVRLPYMKANGQDNLYFLLSVIRECREFKYNIYKKELFVLMKYVIEMVIFW